MISLEGPGSSSYKKSFEGYIDPPSSIGKGWYYTPSSAPFDKAFRKSGSFPTKISEIIQEIYGLNPLIAALKDKDWLIREGVVSALGEIQDSRAVEPLIAVLDEGEYWYGVREGAAEALKKITGEDFGKDPVKWQEWWEKNKANTSESTGTVTGILVDEETGNYLTGWAVQLGVVKSGEGDEITCHLMYDAEFNPKYAGETDENGFFRIDNIPPGRYVIVAAETQGDIDFKSDYGIAEICRGEEVLTLVVQVEACKVYSLGEIKAPLTK